MPKHFLTFSLLFFLTLIAARGQVADSVVFYETFPRQFHLKAVAQTQPSTFGLGVAGDAPQLIYQPNTGPKLGIGANLADIHFLGVVKVPALERNTEEYGKTDYHDFRLDINGKKLIFNFNYQYRNGFYLANIKKLPALSGNEYPLQPGLILESYELIGTYVFNSDKFSYRSIITQADRQRKSAGSFLLGFSTKFFRVAGSGNLVPLRYQSYFDEPLLLDEANLFSFAFMPGYSHTFVVGNFYLNLGAAWGPDLQYKKYRLKPNSATRNEWHLKTKLNLRGGLGFDSGKFFTGIYYLSRRSSYELSGMHLRHDPGFIRVVAGLRFLEPGWMHSIRDLGIYRRMKNIL